MTRGRRSSASARHGFTLLELSVVLFIIALVTGVAISSGIGVIATARQNATVQKMKAIDDALMAYRVAHDRIPCPADLTLPPTNTNYGVEGATPGTCTGGTPAANFSAGGACASAAEGALPAITLGLPADFMYDGWGNRFRYAVDTSMTAVGAFPASVSSYTGAITVNDASGNARSSGAIYALVSHGPNGHGAYTANGTTQSAGSVNANEQTNCHCNAAAVPAAYTPTYVQMAPYADANTSDANYWLNTFDDIVSYKERWQMQTVWETSPSGSTNPTIYVSDEFNSRIRAISPAGIITTYAGNGGFFYSGDGVPAASTSLAVPMGIAVDSSGNLYIADDFNARVREVTAATGIITTLAGNGVFGYGGDGGPATSAYLYGLQDVAVDSTGNIYIADTDNFRVRVVNAASGIINTIAGTGAWGAGYNGDGIPATSANIFPNGVALDGSGNLYIADDFSARIRKVSASTGIITTYAGNGTVGYSGDGGLATSAEINDPNGMAFDTSGNLYFADAENSVIRKVTAATGIITTVVGNGTPGFSGDGGPATSAELTYASDVAVDAANNLYIADGNERIRKVAAATGIITTIAGNGGFGYSGDGGCAAAATMFFPQWVAVYPSAQFPSASSR